MDLLQTKKRDLKSTTAVNLNSQKVTYLENLHSTVHL